MAVVGTLSKGYDLDYIWKTQGQASGEHAIGGYYINAAQGGEQPGRWWGPGAQALGFAVGLVVERRPSTVLIGSRRCTAAKLHKTVLSGNRYSVMRRRPPPVRTQAPA